MRKGSKRTMQVELQKQEQVVRIRRGPDDRMQVREYRVGPDTQPEMDELRRQIEELRKQIEKLDSKK